MSFFCLLWIPLFYLFLKEQRRNTANITAALAVILGSATALVQFFMGNFIEGGAFGFSRWLAVSVDIIAAPVLLPIIVYALFFLLRITRDANGFGGFALLWLIPEGIMRTVQWGVENNPAQLVLAPLLWTAIAVCISFFITLFLRVRREKVYLTVLAILGVLIIAPLASSAYWAYYSQQRLLFLVFTTAAFILFVLAVVFLWRWSFEVTEKKEEKEEEICTT